MPIFAPATYTPQQKQPGLQMSTTTIARTLAEGSAQHTPTQQLPADQSEGGGGGCPVPPGTANGNLFPDNQGQLRATLIRAFRRCLHQQGGGGGGEPPDNDRFGLGGGPPDDLPNGAAL